MEGLLFKPIVLKSMNHLGSLKNGEIIRAVYAPGTEPSDISQRVVFHNSPYELEISRDLSEINRLKGNVNEQVNGLIIPKIDKSLQLSISNGCLRFSGGIITSCIQERNPLMYNKRIGYLTNLGLI